MYIHHDHGVVQSTVYLVHTHWSVDCNTLLNNKIYLIRTNHFYLFALSVSKHDKLEVALRLPFISSNGCCSSSFRSMSIEQSNISFLFLLKLPSV